MPDSFFTIIIPTRDRCDTLRYTLKTALSQEYENYRVIVSDNASTDGTRNMLEEISDPKLKYVNPGKRLSMSEHWEFALSHVTNGWVTILGDDDAILPGALQTVNEIIIKTGTKAVRANGCAYAWPSLLDKSYGHLSLESGKGYRIVSSKKSLDNVLRGRMHYNKLPVLYNGGFVSYDLISRAKSMTNDFYRSITPDVYSAIVFSLLAESYVYSYEALAINGASIHSGGTAIFEVGKKNRSYDPAAKFWSEGGKVFHKDLPLINGRPVRSIPAIIYEAYLQAAPFHDPERVNTTRQKQLQIILSQSGPDPDEVNVWASQFAEMHGLTLDYADGTIFDGVRKLSDTCKDYISRALNVFTIMGDKKLPLKNVNEAALVAATLKRTNPTPLKLLLERFNKLVYLGK
jgi:glycosyltransferase involved in cell wall biosynthesis